LRNDDREEITTAEIEEMKATIEGLTAERDRYRIAAEDSRVAASVLRQQLAESHTETDRLEAERDAAIAESTRLLYLAEWRLETINNLEQAAAAELGKAIATARRRAALLDGEAERLARLAREVGK
jgi:hypothetical protein